MKKLTDLINESLNNKYKFTASVQVEGLVSAENEGSAGEEADKQIDLMQHTLDTYGGQVKVISHQIDDITEFKGTGGTFESIDNNKVLESLDADREGELYQYAQSIVQMILNAEGEVYEGFEERKFVIDEIVRQFNEQITTETSDDDNDTDDGSQGNTGPFPEDNPIRGNY